MSSRPSVAFACTRVAVRATHTKNATPRKRIATLRAEELWGNPFRQHTAAKAGIHGQATSKGRQSTLLFGPNFIPWPHRALPEPKRLVTGLRIPDPWRLTEAVTRSDAGVPADAQSARTGKNLGPLTVG